MGPREEQDNEFLDFSFCFTYPRHGAGEVSNPKCQTVQIIKSPTESVLSLAKRPGNRQPSNTENQYLFYPRQTPQKTLWPCSRAGSWHFIPGSLPIKTMWGTWTSTQQVRVFPLPQPPSLGWWKRRPSGQSELFTTIQK